ncbi:MAG: hypothetical protein OXG74_19140 [Acidobacteria bacterium]|nr:hypothetical protein [Acidobacteriota bacterium]
MTRNPEPIARVVRLPHIEHDRSHLRDAAARYRAAGRHEEAAQLERMRRDLFRVWSGEVSRGLLRQPPVEQGTIGPFRLVLVGEQAALVPV